MNQGWLPTGSLLNDSGWRALRALRRLLILAQDSGGAKRLESSYKEGM